MKEILLSKLEHFKYLSENASNWEYYAGKYNLCVELLDEINKLEQQ